MGRERVYDPMEGEFVDFETLADWEERDKAKDARIEQLEAQVRAADALADAHGKLWSALAEIIESPGMSPNATVRRMAARAEKALVEDTIADLKPVPRFYKAGGAA